jgi:hypothetical protein
MTDEFDGTNGTVKTRNSIALPTTSEEHSIYLDSSHALVSIPLTASTAFGDALGVLQLSSIAAYEFMTPPIPDALRRLERAATQVLEDAADGLDETSQIADRLVTIETARKRLQSAYGPAFATVVQWSLGDLLADETVRKHYAIDYAAENDSTSLATVQRSLDRLKTAQRDTYPRPRLAGTLEGVARTYSRHIAIALARLTLQPDIISGGRASGELAADSAQVDFVGRCQHLADDLEATFDTTDEVPRETLESRLRRASDVDIAEPAPSVQDRADLLAAPLAAAANEPRIAPTAELAGHPSEVGWLLGTVFSDAGVGGVWYPQTQGTLSWMTNPWAESYVTDSSYRHQWGRAVVTDYVLQTLFDAHPDGEVRQKPCPLCAHSRDRCGGEQCAYDTLRTVLNISDRRALCTAISDRQRVD